MISAAKLAIAILAAGALGAFAAELANNFADAPGGHWAKLAFIIAVVPWAAILAMAVVCLSFGALNRLERRKWWPS